MHRFDTLRPTIMRLASACAMFMWIATACTTPRASLTSARTDEGIEIMEGDSSVLFYQVKPKSFDGKFERASYVHPLYSLDGNVITEDFPEDHRHHHGIYFAWHQIVLNGERVADGWTSDNISFEVVDARVNREGKDLAINSEVLWKSPLKDQHPEVIAKENLKITVYPSNGQFRLIDFDMTVVPLKEGMAIGGSDDEKGYGGFSLRLKLPDDMQFIAKGELVEPQVVSVDAGSWMNFAGSFDGKGSQASGVVVLCHPSNPGSPQPWILRRERSMQNVAFPGRHPVVLNNAGLTLRYRVVVSRNVLQERVVEDLFNHYRSF